MAVPALPSGYALQEYRIERLLGAGGFGLTYLAIDTNLNLRVAVKEYLPSDIAVRNPDHSIAPNSSQSAEDFMWGKRRFLDESRTIASFRHPNIVRVMRFFEAKGSAYMVMEYVEGDALSDWIKPRRPLPEAEVTAIAGPLLEGLQVVHTAGYLHRDIKPGNIYIRYDGSPVLLDFGSARQNIGGDDLTAIVTPGYAPFEQYHSQGQQGAWSDVYAFAGVLYWIVTGNRPLEAAARVREDTMPPALKAGDRNRYRPEFLAAIDWALAPHEDDRPQSVHELRAALAGTMEPKPKHAEPAPPPPPPPPAAPEAVLFDANFLDQVERELAQHVGPIAPVMVKKAAKKAQHPAELVQLLAADITHNGLRLKFERRFADPSRPVSRQPTTGSASGRTGPPSGPPFSPDLLSRVESSLSQYLGPVANVVVRRAALKARDESELYLMVADEIEDPAEKKAFIRRAISVSSKV
ncbi:MAG: serine/threonine-protein kinase [Xanthobacteraceae bacterium]